MKRSNFLKGILATTIVAGTIPSVLGTEEEKTFTFDEIFFRPYPNDILIYFRSDHEIYKYIKSNVSGDRIVDDKRFSAYLPKHECLIPIKETYTTDDFEMMILALNGVY